MLLGRELVDWAWCNESVAFVYLLFTIPFITSYYVLYNAAH